MIICKKGDTGIKVRVVQKLLKMIPDGNFGTLTDEVVREFQKKNGLTVDGIVGVKTWQKLLGYSLQPSRRNITEIIVHCTATPEGKDYTVADIRLWHTAPPNNWADIGYHYVIYRNGELHTGRDINLTGAHCTGHNTNSIGIVYVGGCTADGKTPKDTRTEEQKAALLCLLLELHRIYPYAKIHGHRDFAAKDCPSFDATKEYRTI